MLYCNIFMHDSESGTYQSCVGLEYKCVYCSIASICVPPWCSIRYIFRLLHEFLRSQHKPTTFICWSNKSRTFCRSHTLPVAFQSNGFTNFGRLWEAAVKSCEHHLKHVVGSQILTFEEMSTLTSCIEFILNFATTNILIFRHSWPMPFYPKRPSNWSTTRKYSRTKAYTIRTQSS